VKASAFVVVLPQPKNPSEVVTKLLVDDLFMEAITLLVFLQKIAPEIISTKFVADEVFLIATPPSGDPVPNMLLVFKVVNAPVFGVVDPMGPGDVRSTLDPPKKPIN